MDKHSKYTQYMSHTCFFYGTLMAPRVLHGVIASAHSIETHAAVLAGFRRSRVRSAHYPAVVAHDGHSVQGAVVYNLTDADLRRLDQFEGDEYERRVVDVVDSVTGGVVQASVYVWIDSLQRLEEADWDFGQFSAAHIDDFIRDDAVRYERACS